MPRPQGDPTLCADFAVLVRSARTSRGITQQVLSDLTGLDRTSISRLEQGDVNPTLTTIGAIATALQMSITELLAGLDRSPQ